MATPRPYGNNFVLAVRKYLHDNSLKSLGQINAEVLADLAERFYVHHQAQQKQRKKQEVPDGVREIYLAYPRHIAPQDAYAAIRGAIERTPQPTVLAATLSYARCVAKWPHSYRFPKMPDGQERDTVPHPATWFNRGSYNDDPKEWVPAGMFVREDDAKAPNAGVAQQAISAPPQGWQQRVQGTDDETFAGREWSAIPAFYQQRIAKLCNLPTAIYPP